jgi:hypothetical protein
MSCQKVTPRGRKNPVQPLFNRAPIELTSFSERPLLRAGSPDPLGTWSRLDRFDGWEESGRSPRLQPVGTCDRRADGFLFAASDRRASLPKQRILSYRGALWVHS